MTPRRSTIAGATRDLRRARDATRRINPADYRSQREQLEDLTKPLYEEAFKLDPVGTQELTLHVTRAPVFAWQRLTATELRALRRGLYAIVLQGRDRERPSRPRRTRRDASNLPIPVDLNDEEARLFERGDRRIRSYIIREAKGASGQAHGVARVLADPPGLNFFQKLFGGRQAARELGKVRF